jgi:hypothetical protein
MQWRTLPWDRRSKKNEDVTHFMLLRFARPWNKPLRTAWPFLQDFCQLKGCRLPGCVLSIGIGASNYN